MSNSTASTLIQRLAAPIVLLSLVVTVAGAQDAAPRPRAWEFRVASGALVPTGEQRRALKSASLTAAQLSWSPRPSLAVTGTFGWARSRDLLTAGTPKLNALTADLGVETRTAPWFATRAVTFSPFAGLGTGSRSYDYRDLHMNATHNLAGYAAVGGELGAGRVGLRVELRDYVSGFKPLAAAGKGDARNDAMLMIAARFNRRAAAHR